MTFYELVCRFCYRKIGVFSDELNPKGHPDGVFCDYDCWAGQAHPVIPVHKA